jgi:hypothetical protein
MGTIENDGKVRILLNLTMNNLINERIQSYFKYEIQFLGSWLLAVNAGSSASSLASCHSGDAT